MGRVGLRCVLDERAVLRLDARAMGLCKRSGLFQTRTRMQRNTEVALVAMLAVRATGAHHSVQPRALPRVDTRALVRGVRSSPTSRSGLATCASAARWGACTRFGLKGVLLGRLWLSRTSSALAERVCVCPAAPRSGTRESASSANPRTPGLPASASVGAGLEAALPAVAASRGQSR